MTQARNFAARAYRSFQNNYKFWIDFFETTDEIALFALLMDNIKQGVHFSLPEDGRILNDGLIGLRGEEARLPYPTITLEFVSTDRGDGFGNVSVLLVAQEASSLKKYGADIEGDWISVSGAFMERHNRENWSPFATSFKIPRTWDETIKEQGMFSAEPVEMFPSVTKLQAKQYGTSIEEVFKEACVGFAWLVSSVLELCEALSCSNVEVGTLQEASPKNTKRIKQGKLPILETKTLVINTHRQPGTGKGYQLDGNKRSPRQHLRRGHIRFLQSDRYKNKQGQKIWVNSAVVGGEGKIEKNYEVR